MAIGSSPRVLPHPLRRTQHHHALALAALFLLVQLSSSPGAKAGQALDRSSGSAYCFSRWQRLSSSFPKATPEEVAQLTASYTNTSALQRLEAGWVGDVHLPSATAGMASSVRQAASFMLRMCSEFSDLVAPLRQAGGEWLVPPEPPLPACAKRLHVVVVTPFPIKQGPGLTNQMIGSFRMRGLTLPSELLKRGHLVSWYSQADHARRFANCTSDPEYAFPFARESALEGRADVVVIPKVVPRDLLRCFRHHRVPVVLDIIDSTAEFRELAALGLTLILATSRLAAAAYAHHAGTPSAVVYHQPPNTFGFSRGNRRRRVFNVALVHQRDNHVHENLRAAKVLGSYCARHGLRLRTSGYAGHGFDQAEMRAYGLQAHADAGEQMGFAMGYSSIDIMVVWLHCHIPETICVKPTTRLLAGMSLGIPTIFAGSAAYLDIVVAHGYPLVAPTLERAVELVDLLVKDADLRQAVSELGLRIARGPYALQRLADDYERALCSVAQ